MLRALIMLARRGAAPLACVALEADPRRREAACMPPRSLPPPGAASSSPTEPPAQTGVDAGPSGVPPAGPPATSVPLSEHELDTWTTEEIMARAADVKRKDCLPPPPIGAPTALWQPQILMADGAPAQRNAFRAVFSGEASRAWRAGFTTARATIERHVIQPPSAVRDVPLLGNCSWHVLHELDQQRGTLFNDHVQHLDLVKSDIDAYRKRIGFHHMGPVAWTAMNGADPLRVQGTQGG